MPDQPAGNENLIEQRMDRLTRLGYWEDGRVNAIPAWARYMIRLGAAVASSPTSERRVVVGLSVPTRAFAAAFCALGVAAAVYDDPERDGSSAHFEWLTSLPAGTPVRYRQGTHLHTGQLLGKEIRESAEYVAIECKSVKYLRPASSCLDIQPLEQGETFVRRRQLAANPEFVRAVLPDVNPLTHASYSNVDCLVVGVKDSLHTEVCEEVFTAQVAPERVVSGVLNDVLRCDAFELNANDHDRTRVVSAFSDGDVAQALSPPVVIFDGPAAFLRLRSRWRSSHWIVAIDRTSASAVMAADAFNQEYAMSIRDCRLAGLPNQPAGVELTSYEARAL